jgi:hypothetical protein
VAIKTDPIKYMKLLFTLLLTLLFFIKGNSQVFIIYPIDQIGQAAMPEHGFLPGKKFQFYPTIEKYDFPGTRIRVELFDDRDSLNIIRLDCSPTETTNKSEFIGQAGTSTVYQYFQQIFSQSGIQIDTAAKDTLKIELQALDSRMIGFRKITAHGLCQMKINFKNISKIYCIDITDKDKHSPISSNAMVTRKTATRIITSAAIREVIEQFLSDLKGITKN